MDILIFTGIALIVVFVVIVLKKQGDKKINYKDRIKLDTLLEDEELIEKDDVSATGNPAPDSADVLLPNVNIQDDSIVTIADESVKYYDNGVALVKAKRYEDSIPQLNKAIRLNPSDAAVYYYRGIAKIELKLYNDAIADFTDAMLRQTKKIDAFFQRGCARLKTGDKDNALLDFTHYIAVEKNNPEAYYKKGVLEYDKGNFQAAIDDFSNTIILNTNHASAYFKRGMAKQKTGDINGCCKDLKTAFDKGNLEAYHHMKKFCDK